MVVGDSKGYGELDPTLAKLGPIPYYGLPRQFASESKAYVTYCTTSVNGIDDDIEPEVAVTVSM